MMHFLCAMAGSLNRFFFPGSESGFKADFSRVKFQKNSSPKRSSKTSPGNGLKTRPKHFLEFCCALRKKAPRALCGVDPIESGPFFTILALAIGQ
jgi:hypothetical protein